MLPYYLVEESDSTRSVHLSLALFYGFDTYGYSVETGYSDKLLAQN